MQIRPVVTEVFHSDRCDEGHSCIQNFAKVPNDSIQSSGKTCSFFFRILIQDEVFQGNLHMDIISHQIIYTTLFRKKKKPSPEF